jgi:hypothetical protein
MCGGHGRQNVYSIGDEAPIDILPTAAIDYNLIGCYIDSASARDLDGLATNMGRSASAATVRPIPTLSALHC